MTESVVVLIIRQSHCLVASHVPHNGERGAQEYQLHHSIVQRYVSGKNIQVPRGKYKGIQLLRL